MLEVEYFDDGNWKPGIRMRCSDPDCQAQQPSLSYGEGYLYIPFRIVEFRQVYRTHEKAVAEMDRRIREKYGRPISYVCRIGPMLICANCAKRLGLNLDVAAEDAKHWWETGRAPLRVTPLFGDSKHRQRKPVRSDSLGKIN